MNEAQLRNLSDKEFIAHIQPTTDLEFELIRRLERRLGFLPEKTEVHGEPFMPRPYSLGG